MKLNQYLEKIEQGKAINLDRFISLLPFADTQEWRKIYSAERVRAGYLLSIDDHQRHRSLFITESEDRTTASKYGRSHDFPSSFAHILVLNSNCQQSLPFVVVSDQQGYSMAGSIQGKRAVIIENIENFYRYHEFFHAIGRSDLINGCDILFGSGNQICHHLNRKFLSGFQQIFCAQDLDLGGLTIYHTLKKHLPQCQWLAPVDWYLYREQFKLKPNDASHLADAIALARKLGLNQEAELINQTRHFMEQEALLPACTQD